MKKPFLILLALTLHGVVAQAASLSFSGGNGSPVTLTLNQPIQLTITTATASGAAPFFAFDGVGNYIGSETNSTGSLTYQINSGSPATVSRIGTNVSGSSITADDLYFYGNTRPALVVGDVVTILAGSLTTGTNIAGAAPASGNYQGFIFANTSGFPQVSGFASAVPEPSTWALLSVGAVGVVAFLRRRQTPV